MGEIKGVEGPVCEHAQQRGYHVRKLQWIGRRAAPDRLFFGKGENFLIEFKDYGEEPEDHQWREIHRMRSNGIAVYVINRPDHGRALFDRRVVDRHAHAISLWPTPERFLQIS